MLQKNIYKTMNVGFVNKWQKICMLRKLTSLLVNAIYNLSFKAVQDKPR